jgi:hypothetical protein
LGWSPARFVRLDINQDGFVDREEFITGGKPAR